MKTPSLLPIISLAALLFGVGTARSQNAPDKLVFKGDSTLVDSLRRTDYPYLFPIWGDKVRKMGISLPLSAGIGVNYMWGESELVIDNLSVGFNNGPMTNIDEVVRIENGLASVSGVNVRPDLWVLPFLNVYGMAATIDGRATDVAFKVNPIPGMPPLPIPATIEPTYTGHF